MGGDLLYTGFQGFIGSDQNGHISGARATFERHDVKGQLLGPLHATSISGGDTFTPALAIGPRGVGGRGFGFSTAPLEQTSVFNRIDLRGELPVGYDVELYVNDILRSGQRTPVNGRYEFLNVPLVRGVNVIRVEAAPAHLKHGVDYILHAVLDFIVDGYFPIVEAIEEEVLVMERQALDAFLNREQVSRIFNLRRDLMRFRRILGPMEEVASRFEHHRFPCIDLEIQPYFSDVRDHIRRVVSLVEGLRDVLSSVFEASNLLEQQRQGAITRRLAAWAGILAVPTAIAGIYGMNFEFMPELHWKYGYFLVVGMIAVICVFLYSRFKRANWL